MSLLLDESGFVGNKGTVFVLGEVSIRRSLTVFHLTLNCFVCVFEQNIRNYFNKHTEFTSLMWSTAVAIFAVGGMSGALVGPVIASSLGR